MPLFQLTAIQGPDEELIKYIDIANVMLKTVRMAKRHNVKISANPGFQDLFGLGRRRIEVHPEDIYASILYQVGALKAFWEAEGIPLNHIKPLYAARRFDHGCGSTCSGCIQRSCLRVQKRDTEGDVREIQSVVSGGALRGYRLQP
jgi:hypothetical protein